MGSLADSVLDPGTGIAWLNDGTLYALSPPRYDSNGNGLILALQHDTTPAIRKAIAPAGLGQRLENWFMKQMALQGEAQMQQAQAELAAGKAVDDFVTTAYHRAVGRDRGDTASMAIDIVCIALSVVLIATGGAEVLGVIALAGGVAMLLMDGTAYVQELAGDDEMAERTKDATFDFRLLAMVAALPDAIWNVGKVSWRKAARRYPRRLASTLSCRVQLAMRPVPALQPDVPPRRWRQIGLLPGPGVTPRSARRPGRVRLQRDCDCDCI